MSILYFLTDLTEFYISFCIEIPVFVDSPQDVLLSTGSNFTLTCNATGVPFPQLAWYKDGVLLTASIPGRLDVQTNEISVYNVTLSDQGVYSCVASNAAGSSLANAMVDIISKLKLQMGKLSHL